VLFSKKCGILINKVTSNTLNSYSKRQGDVEKANQNNGKKGKNPNFAGVLDLAMVPLQYCEKIPMLNVSVLDCTTAIGPRTYEESKTNIFAGFEALRRESSGLLVNCIFPSFIVMFVAHFLQKPIFGHKTPLAKNWADEDTINAVSKYWKKSEGEGAEKVSSTLNSIIKEIKGIKDKTGTEHSFSDLIDDNKEIDLGKNGKTTFAKELEDLAKKISSGKKLEAKDCNNLYKCIIQQTHIEAKEHIKFAGKESELNVKAILQNASGLIKEFTNQKAYKNELVDEITNKAIKLVNKKSTIGLFGIIIPLALSMQPINRFITEKVSGKKGAPIYKDFTSDDKKKELTSSEKGKLWFHKILSAAALCGVAFVAMDRKLPNKKMLQFKNIFPTMNQARLISVATFASRILSSQDENDRREATIRDIGTFSALYFVGDYVAKAVATLIEKINPKVSLTNAKKALAKNANVWQKLKHWAADTSLKSTEEVLDKNAKTMRSVCQLGNILFSFFLLGKIIPKVTRHMTDKHHEEDMKKQGMTEEQISKYYQDKNPKTSANGGASTKAAYRPFFTAGVTECSK
jgi:hypothetical protein